MYISFVICVFVIKYQMPLGAICREKWEQRRCHQIDNNRYKGTISHQSDQNHKRMDVLGICDNSIHAY